MASKNGKRDERDDEQTGEQTGQADDQTGEQTDTGTDSGEQTDDQTDDQTGEQTDEQGDEQSNPETFSRGYVEGLRAENAKHRVRANDLAARLHTELVRGTGKLADPTDLPFDAAHLESPEALLAAIEELLSAKPHFGSRRVSGSVGQGVKGDSGGGSLLGQLKKLV